VAAFIVIGGADQTPHAARNAKRRNSPSGHSAGSRKAFGREIPAGWIRKNLDSAASRFAQAAPSRRLQIFPLCVKDGRLN
jgi:hypothetical protein